MDCSLLIGIWTYYEYVLAIQRLETHKLHSQTNVYTSSVITETGISGSPTSTLEQVLLFFGVELIFKPTERHQNTNYFISMALRPCIWLQYSKPS